MTCFAQNKNKTLAGLREKFYKHKTIIVHHLNTRSYLLIIIFLICLSGFFYLLQINGLATKGYQIKDLEMKVSELKSVNKKLELQITELRSMDRVAQEIDRLGMEQVSRIEYLKPNGNSVAVNR